MSSIPHITVCICTFKRPGLLRKTVEGVLGQKTGDSFTFSIVVVDNDVARSAEATIAAIRGFSSTLISYDVEPVQNIALARNRAILHAESDFIAFIDDDEIPNHDWLHLLFLSLREYMVDGVLGPVLPAFEQKPADWIRKGEFFDRPRHESGFILPWTKCRTGNVLFKREILQGEEAFRREFGSGGEDRDFFIRMIEHGRRFAWCDEAIVQEVVPSVRCNPSFMLRRALLRGKAAVQHKNGMRDLAKSAFAVIAYLLALPIAALLGRHKAMKVLIRTCDHAGKLLAWCGLNPIREKYVLE
ncbi:MAG TPA: glycosyltransferase family 2 protein [Verrucomicrobiae bacterium]|nr:glycosyltransferase family 2 protein [Verrucomicrobiae bacterium]